MIRFCLWGDLFCAKDLTFLIYYLFGRWENGGKNEWKGKDLIAQGESIWLLFFLGCQRGFWEFVSCLFLLFSHQPINLQLQGFQFQSAVKASTLSRNRRWSQIRNSSEDLFPFLRISYVCLGFWFVVRFCRGKSWKLWSLGLHCEELYFGC